MSFTDKAERVLQRTRAKLENEPDPVKREKMIKGIDQLAQSEDFKQRIALIMEPEQGRA